jgi:hypothetical protein
VNTPLQSLASCWLPGNVQLAFQLLVAPLPALLMTTWAWKPPDQEFVTEYAHDSCAGSGLLGGVLAVERPVGPAHPRVALDVGQLVELLTGPQRSWTAVLIVG